MSSVPKLRNVVKNDLVEKTEYDQLVNKVNGIDTTNFVSRTKYEKDGSDFEDKINKIDEKIHDVSDLVKKPALTTVKNRILDSLATKFTLTAVENKIPDVSDLTTTAVENKIPDITSLVTKTDFDAKLKAISDRVTKN